MGNVADAVEIMCVGFIMTEIPSLTSLDKELLSAAAFIGMLLGGSIGGIVSDILGRKRCLLYSLGLNALAGVLSAFSVNIGMLVFLRILAGLGIGGSVPIVFSLGAEIFPQSQRGQYLLVIASCWMVGAIYAALFAWIMMGDDLSGNRIIPNLSWRYYAGICSVPAFVAFTLTYMYVPESPRFLLSKGRTEEACQILNDISTVRIEPNDLKHEQIAFAAVPTTDESSDINIRVLTGSSKREHPLRVATGSWRIIFSPAYLRTSLVLTIIWFTLSFGSYGISNWISTLFADVGIGNPYAASFIFAVANFPGNVVSIWLVDSVGRRWLLSVGMCLAGVSCLGFAMDQENQAVVVLSASLFNAFSVMGWNSLDCLAAEAFPTRVRSTAMGMLAASGRLGAICGQFVNGALESNIPLLLFVTCGCSLLGGISAWALPNDTAGMSLDDGNGSEDESHPVDSISPSNSPPLSRHDLEETSSPLYHSR